MHRFGTFFYGIGQGLKNIRRNRLFSLASIATMAACLFLFGVFYSVIANFRSVLSEAEQRVGITVFFNAGISNEEISSIGTKIKTRAEVAEIELTTAEQAWENYKQSGLSAELIETFGNDNPLADSASYTVFLNDVDMQESLVKFIKAIPGVRKVNEKRDVSKSISGLNKILTVIAVAIILILLGVAVFLINITISTGVTVRSREISIMKLIGATDHFIRIPYIVEGILIGFIGALIPVVILQFCYGWIISALQGNFSTLLTNASFVETKDIMVVLSPVSLIMGISIGFIGSNMALGRQLKKIDSVGEE